jgi:hypothetical protein
LAPSILDHGCIRTKALSHLSGFTAEMGAKDVHWLGYWAGRTGDLMMSSCVSLIATLAIFTKSNLI